MCVCAESLSQYIGISVYTYICIHPSSCLVPAESQPELKKPLNTPLNARSNTNTKKKTKNSPILNRTWARSGFQT